MSEAPKSPNLTPGDRHKDSAATPTEIDDDGVWKKLADPLFEAANQRDFVASLESRQELVSTQRPESAVAPADTSSPLDNLHALASEEVFGVTLSHLDMRAQSAMLKYVAAASEYDVLSFTKLLAEYTEVDREKICSAFLAFESDASLGGYIIEKLFEMPREAFKIMSVIYELIGTTGKVEDFLLNEFKTSHDKKDISSARTKLIATAHDMLLEWHSRLWSLDHMAEIASGAEMLDAYPDIAHDYGYTTGESKEHWSRHDEAKQRLIDDVARQMTELNVSQILFLNTFKSLKESGSSFTLEDVRNSSFQELYGEHISPEYVMQMRDIYFANQSSNPNVQKALMKKFEDMLHDVETRFYLFTYRGQVQSFVAFSDAGWDTIRASAFNVAPVSRGYRIGDSMLHDAIDREATRSKLTADCDSKLPISGKYIETGWIATRYWDDHGDKILDIARDDSRRERYWGKHQTQEALITGTAPEGVTIKTAKTQGALPFDLCNQGKALTRMFFDQKTGQYYGVFESALPAHRE